VCVCVCVCSRVVEKGTETTTIEEDGVITSRTVKPATSMFWDCLLLQCQTQCCADVCCTLDT